MKKIIFSTLAFTTSLMMMGEGYQVNTLSVKQEGMAHTGVAQKLGAESMLFNPAGMAFMDTKADFSAGITGIFSEATAAHNGNTYTTDNDVSTPFQVSAAFSILDNLKVGVTVNTPFGSGINWGNDWPGATLSQSTTLQVFNIQPTVAYKILPNLSVGAGLMVAWGSVDLNKGLIIADSFDKVLAMNGVPAEYYLNGTTPASINLKGSAKVAFGFNVGTMWDINDKFTIGASYKSKMGMKVEAGDATVAYANDLAKSQLSAIANLDGAKFSAELPAVSQLTFGVTYKPIKKLKLAFDAQLNGWGVYDNLKIDFLGDELGSQFDQTLAKNYSDAWTFRLGAEYNLIKQLDLRAGVVIDQSPVKDNFLNPETPSMTRLLPSVGLSYRPIKNLSIDLAFTYVEGFAREGSCSYTDLLAAQVYQTAYQTALGYGMTPDLAAAAAGQAVAPFGGVEKTFNAKYDIKAFIPAIGLSYSF